MGLHVARVRPMTVLCLATATFSASTSPTSRLTATKVCATTEIRARTWSSVGTASAWALRRGRRRKRRQCNPRALRVRRRRVHPQLRPLYLHLSQLDRHYHLTRVNASQAKLSQSAERRRSVATRCALHSWAARLAAPRAQRKWRITPIATTRYRARSQTCASTASVWACLFRGRSM